MKYMTKNIFLTSCLALVYATTIQAVDPIPSLIRKTTISLPRDTNGIPDIHAMVISGQFLGVIQAFPDPIAPIDARLQDLIDNGFPDDNLSHYEQYLNQWIDDEASWNTHSALILWQAQEDTTPRPDRIGRIQLLRNNKIETVTQTFKSIPKLTAQQTRDLIGNPNILALMRTTLQHRLNYLFLGMVSHEIIVNQVKDEYTDIVADSLEFSHNETLHTYGTKYAEAQNTLVESINAFLTPHQPTPIKQSWWRTCFPGKKKIS